MNNTTTWSQLTDYHNIYKRVYWGGHTLNSKHPGQEIINNRNRFIEKHKITKSILSDHHIRKLKTSQDFCGDHGECYRTAKDEIIYISSPYVSPHEKRKIGRLAKAIGWQKTAKLYTKDSQTFMIKFDGLNHMKMAIQVLGSKAEHGEG